MKIKSSLRWLRDKQKQLHHDNRDNWLLRRITMANIDILLA